MMERLRKKGYLVRRLDAGVYRYRARATSAELMQGAVERFVARHLGGSVSPFLAYLSDAGDLSDAELRELADVVNKLQSVRRKGGGRDDRYRPAPRVADRTAEPSLYATVYSFRMPASLQLHWFHILLALANGPQHGVGITQDVLKQSEGQLQLWPGMLYTALRKMADAGYVVETAAPEGFSAGGGKPRFYRLTPIGKRVCAAEAARLSRIVGAAHDKRVLKGTRAV